MQTGDHLEDHVAMGIKRNNTFRYHSYLIKNDPIMAVIAIPGTVQLRSTQHRCSLSPENSQKLAAEQEPELKSNLDQRVVL